VGGAKVFTAGAFPDGAPGLLIVGFMDCLPANIAPDL
jgi:hypothetical protein